MMISLKGVPLEAEARVDSTERHVCFIVFIYHRHLALLHHVGIFFKMHQQRKLHGYRDSHWVVLQ